MRIGELSRRAGVSVRMLRYYEQQALLAPARGTNGYREYGEDDVARARLVASLVRSGLPTRLITPLLRLRCCPAGTAPPEDDALAPTGAPTGGEGGDLVPLFRSELRRLEERIACLTTSRDAVAAHLRQLGAGPEPAAPQPTARQPTARQPAARQPAAPQPATSSRRPRPRALPRSPASSASTTPLGPGLQPVQLDHAQVRGPDLQEGDVRTTGSQRAVRGLASPAGAGSRRTRSTAR